MKKRIFPLLLASLCLVACGDKGKGVKNEEFEEYSSQVLSVMYDVGLITQLPETETGASEKGGQKGKVAALSAKSGGATFAEQKDGIWQTLQGFADKTESDTLNFYTDIFEQTFYIPLIMGDALAAYYNVSSFYGVCSNTPWNQYVTTEKAGDVKTTYVYTPAGEVFEKETMISMRLDYQSQDEYTVNVKQFSSDLSNRLYAYLDSDGNFLAVSHEVGNANNCYVTYSNDGFNGYSVTDTDTVNEIVGCIAGEFTSENQEKIRAVQSRSQYTVDEEKWGKAQEKYFGDSNKAFSPYEWADEDETVLMGYRCFETTEEIVVPARARYLLDNFHISYGDGVESTKTLIIPKTVKGIKTQQEGGVLPDVAVSEFRISTHDHSPLDAIVVESGSALFQSGTGHLLDLQGNVVCYANCAHPTGKLDFYTFFYEREQVLPLEFYPVLAASIREITYDDTNQTPLIADFMYILQSCTNVRKLSVKTSETFSSLDVTTQGDLDLTVDAPTSFSVRIYGGNRQSNLSVTLLNLTCLSLGVDAESSVWKSITVSLPWSEQYYDYLMQCGNGGVWIRTKEMKPDEIEWVFSDSGNLYDMTGITIERNDGTGAYKAVVDTSAAVSITVPAEYYGETFSEVLIVNNATAPVTVTVPDSVTKIRFEQMNEENGYGTNLTVVYGKTYQAFQDAVREDTSFGEVVLPYFVKVSCNDFDGYYSNVKISLRFQNENAEVDFTETVTVELKDGGNGNFIYYAKCMGTRFVEYPQDDKAYYYTDQNGKNYDLEWISNGSCYQIYIPFETYDDIRNLTLTYHEKTRGFRLTVQVVDGNTTMLIFDEELAYAELVHISAVLSPDETKKYIVITVMGMGDGVNGSDAFEEIKYEIALNQGFECTLNDEYYQNNMEIQMNADTVLQLQLITLEN